MVRGVLPIDTVPGPVDLQSTLESGQTYGWSRQDGAMYTSTDGYGGSDWYSTVVDGHVIRVRQSDGRLEWESSADAVPYLRTLLRLDDDLDEIMAATPTDPLVSRAYAAYRGMRIVRDPFFRCLISFICSAQMRVERIYSMQVGLAEAYGEPIRFDGRTYHAFPTPDAVAEATEADLRELGLGYRAPYVQQTAEAISTGAIVPADIPGTYEPARDALTAYTGVGQKVADCVCLFSLGHLEAVPLDTWIRSAIERYYPHCQGDTYAETSRAIRAEFGPYAGYAQTYVFHYLRSRGIDTDP